MLTAASFYIIFAVTSRLVLLSALGAQEWSRDLSVTMTFATSRIEQLQADLKANSALISTALLHAYA